MLKTLLGGVLPRTTYRIRAGLARGLKRSGGLGFLERPRALTREEEFLSRLDLVGATVYDVGALKGMTTLFFAKAVGPSGRVITFEPNQSNGFEIRANLSINGFANVTVFDIGLGAKPETRTLTVPKGRPGQGSISDEIGEVHRGQAGTSLLKVPIRPLDAVRNAEGLPLPNLVKIDVEGAEAEVIEGAEQTLREGKPALFVEIHGANDLQRSRIVRRIVELTDAAGYLPPLHVESTRTLTDLGTEVIHGHLWLVARGSTGRRF